MDRRSVQRSVCGRRRPQPHVCSRAEDWQRQTTRLFDSDHSQQDNGVATMNGLSISRRNLILGTAAAALGGLAPRQSRAAGTFAATVYPGPWEEAYRQFVVPRMKQMHNI